MSTACVHHPAQPEVRRCDDCERPLCDACFVELAERTVCGACKHTLLRRLLRGEHVGSARRFPPPWEQKRSLATLWLTIKKAALSPEPFFRSLPHQGRFHFLYALLVGWPSSWVGGSLWYLGSAALSGQPEQLKMSLWIVAGLAVAIPISILLSVVIGGAVTHLFLHLLHAANAPLEATVRTLCYVNSPHVLAVIPCAGGPVASLWALVLQVIGLKEVHATGYAQAVGAVLLPYVLCCVGFGVLWASILGGLLAGAPR